MAFSCVLETRSMMAGYCHFATVAFQSQSSNTPVQFPRVSCNSPSHTQGQNRYTECLSLQEYSVQLTFREQWTDERLKFNDFGG
jgi:hypothetical protein